jgi:hypothetical protein
VHLDGPGMAECSPSPELIIPMPHKYNAARRHHIPKMSFKVRNWPAYEAGLRRQGSLTLRVEDAALECWQTIGPSGQARNWLRVSASAGACVHNDTGMIRGWDGIRGVSH